MPSSTRTLDRLSGKADEFGRVRRRLFRDHRRLAPIGAEARASREELRAAPRALAQRSRELERVRARPSAESERTLDDLRHRFSSVSRRVTTRARHRCRAASPTPPRRCASRPPDAAADIAAEQARLRDRGRTPAGRDARERGSHAPRPAGPAPGPRSAVAARRALGRAARRRAAARAAAAPRRCRPTPQPPRASMSRARSLTCAVRRPSRRSSATAQRQRRRRRPDNREGWSLGDLLARASRDEDGHGHPAAPPAPQRRRSRFHLDVEADRPRARPGHGRPRSGSGSAPASAASWCAASIRPKARAVFDEISHALSQADGELPRTVEPLPRRLRAHHLAKPTRAIRRAAWRTTISSPTPAASICSSPTRAAVSAERAHGADSRDMPLSASQPQRAVEAWPLARAVRHRARRQDRGRASSSCTVGDGDARRPRRSRALRALRRDRRGRVAALRGLRGPLTTARALRRSRCRRAPRATRSTARCGTSRPSEPGSAPGELAGPRAAAPALDLLHAEPRHARARWRPRPRGRAAPAAAEAQARRRRRRRAHARRARRAARCAPRRRRQRGLDARACWRRCSPPPPRPASS